MRFYLLIPMLALGAGLCAQELPDDRPAPNTRAFYLERSKHQKTAAWVMLGAGTLAAVIGAATAASDFDIDLSGNSKPDKSTSGSEVAAFGGLALIAGSVPLFLASGRNKRKAAVLLKSETGATPAGRQPFAALALRLYL
ncbi:hypothetical protein [Flaviaesturariibacter aridisoli]|uniref:Uncharacterized protein n=1 Tax=Flaviaesturariibacter aridisoli TaxID=2545761 RepID=A0A4R4E1L6_9BACT|nr:hypothetical protein [Flaviaesturariibacter aridisoli]TCZ69661.1 hypothetical protein E0486_12110 [Flaviaesturariibacter aridisoli]